MTDDFDARLDAFLMANLDEQGHYFEDRLANARMPDIVTPERESLLCGVLNELRAEYGDDVVLPDAIDTSTFGPDGINRSEIKVTNADRAAWRQMLDEQRGNR